MRLSKRLNAIIDLCDECPCIIDVGTDHGKVPITIANLGLAKHVIALDKNKGPLLTCDSNKEKFLTNKDILFETLISDGLANISKELECGIIITGIGYDLMCDILKDINEYNYKYLILSPHTKANLFMKFLFEKHLYIDKIRTVYEDDNCYFIFKVIKSNHNSCKTIKSVVE